MDEKFHNFEILTFIFIFYFPLYFLRFSFFYSPFTIRYSLF